MIESGDDGGRRRGHVGHLPGHAEKSAAQPDEENMTEEPKMPFGKYRGKPLSEILKGDPSYLAWFYCNVDGNDDIKRAIRALPGFYGTPAKSRQPVGTSFDEMFCLDPRLTREDIDRLCWEILHPVEGD